MTAFQQALEIVHSALHGLHENGADLRATSAALAQLAASPSSSFRAERSGAGECLTQVESGAAPSHAVRSAPPPPAEIRGSSAPLRSARNDNGEEAAPGRLAPLGARGRKAERLATIQAPILACGKCEHLVQSRTQVVFGVGNPDAELMFVGEAPGEDEDLSGEPFVGKAGQLLTKIIEAMGFPRADVYIANILKCRPDMPAGASGNRKPRPDEMQTCLPYLKEQIAIIQPRAIVALGATAMAGLLGETQPMSQLRGRWHEFDGIPLMATYHPAYLLRNQSLGEKRKVWEDMLLVLERLGRPISERQRNFFLARG